MGKPGKYGGKGRMYNNPSFHKGKGLGLTEVTWQTALDRLRETDPTPGVPSWNGDPDRFPTFTQECAWYLASLKENEKALGTRSSKSVGESAQFGEAVCVPIAGERLLWS